jgi:hypothetical protein
MDSKDFAKLNDLLKVDDDVDTSADDLPGTGEAPKLLDTGIYDVQLDLAYLEESRGGALALKTVFLAGSNKIRHNFWITSGNAKGKKNYYVTKDGVKRLLPGFAQANALCQILTGKDLSELKPKDKYVPYYDFDLRKELNKEAPTFMELLGKTFKAGIIRKVENKRAQDDYGKWVPTADKRELNEVDRIFDRKGFTANELKAGETEPKAIKAWTERFKDQVVDRYDSSVKPAAVETQGIFNKSDSTDSSDEIPF